MLTRFAADLGRYREIRRHAQLRNSRAAVIRCGSPTFWPDLVGRKTDPV